MKLIKMSNIILIIITSIISLFYVVNDLMNYNIYDELIAFSIVPVMLLPYIIRKIFKVKINETIIFTYLIFIFFGYFLGSILNWYNTIEHYDKITHLISGIMTSFLALIILISFKSYNSKKLFNILFIIVFSLAIASLWEMFEFTFDKLFSKDAQHVITTGVDDTMLDIVMAFLGTIIFSIIYFVEEKTNYKGIIKAFIKELNDDGK